jgi:hypothetical protein
MYTDSSLRFRVIHAASKFRFDIEDEHEKPSILFRCIGDDKITHCAAVLFYTSIWSMSACGAIYRFEQDLHYWFAATSFAESFRDQLATPSSSTAQITYNDSQH